MYIICIVMAIVSFLYFMGIVLFRGVGSNFHYCWLALSIILAIVGFEWKYHFLVNRIPGVCIRIMKIGFIAGLLLFVFVEGCIVASFQEKGEKNLEYIIVLGAQVRSTGPSRALQMRLDCAYDYLIANQQTIVVVSGGQGSDEPMSEAQCMQEYLVNRGIAAERIILEDKSTNTHQNLVYSKKLLPEGTNKVGVVTNNFHVFRGVKIAKRAGFEEAQGLAAKTYLPLLASDMMREFFGVIKDVAMGNM